eukprot:3505304-Rhodomonas_salina.3
MPGTLYDQRPRTTVPRDRRDIRCAIGLRRCYAMPGTDVAYDPASATNKTAGHRRSWYCSIRLGA